MNGLMVEGTAEQAIIDLLLKNNLLALNKDSLIQSPQNEFYQVGLNAKNFSVIF